MQAINLAPLPQRGVLTLVFCVYGMAAQHNTVWAQLPQDSVPQLPAVTVKPTGQDWESPPGHIAERSATATKTDTRLGDTAASISVVTRDQMRDQAVTSTAQALRYSPGVVAEARASARYDTVFLRGFGGFGQSANYVNYLDGLRLPRGLSYLVPSIDPWALERIDLVRGPNSVLYGQASPGGLVNQVTRRPVFERVRELQLSAGNHNLRQASIDLGDAVNTDGTLAWRLVALTRDAKSTSGLTERRHLLAPALTWKPQAQTELNIQAYVQRDPHAGDYNGLPAHGTLLPHPLGRIPYDLVTTEPAFERFDRTQNSLSWRLDHAFSDTLHLRHQGRWLSADSQYRNISAALLNPANSILLRQASAADEDLDGLNTDTQLRWRVRTGQVQHTLLAGLDWQRSKATRQLGSGAPGMPLDFLNPTYGMDVATPAFTSDAQRRQTQLGVYLQDQLELGAWLAQVGLRQDRARDTDDVTVLTSGVHTQLRQRDSKLSGSASLMYRFSNGLSPYFSYSTSFEPTTAINLNGDPFKPSTARQLELGAKFQPAQQGILLSAAVFELERRNVLTKDPTPGVPATQQIQTGEIRVRGAEFEGRAELTPRLDAIGSLTWLDAKVTRSHVDGEQGNRPVGVPQRTASAWLDWRVLPGQLGLSIGARHVSSSRADVQNTLRVPGYTLLDLGVRYELGHLQPALSGMQLALNVSNATNKQYLAACAPAGVGTGCFVGPQRQWTATLRYLW